MSCWQDAITQFFACLGLSHSPVKHASPSCNTGLITMKVFTHNVHTTEVLIPEVPEVTTTYHHTGTFLPFMTT